MLTFKRYILEDVDNLPDILYHVTFTKNVPKIKQKGILLLQTTNWVQAKNKKRYGKGEIYAMSSFKDAKRWALNMDWAFNTKMGSGLISVISFKNDGGWEIDEADPLSQISNEGKWLKKTAWIKPEDILDSTPIVL